MRNTNLEFLLFSFLLLTGCKLYMDKVYGIEVVNDSSDEVMFFVASLGWENLYPDTLLPATELSFRSIASGRSSTRYSDLEWEEIIQELPADTLSVFILDPVVLENRAWEDVRDNYRVLKRYDLSITDLERLEFRVTYPPNQNMEGIRMFPPN